MSTNFNIGAPPPETATPTADVPPQLLDELKRKIEQRTMMLFGVERQMHLTTTLTARARLKTNGDVSSYVQSVLNVTGDSEFMALIDHLTINETSFFRNVPQMNLFSKVIVPEIVAAKRTSGGPKQLNIWSAACSTGQEAYTLAILAYEALRFIPAWDVKVYATDIAPTVLEIARKGVYPKARLEMMPVEILNRYFEQSGDEIKVKDILRKLTTFMVHNLRDPFPPIIFDVIFCRNVMIYFSREDQTKLASRFCERLAPGGHLFIGHSESLQGLNASLRLRLQDGGVAYQRTENLIGR
jgi:chemotaxis protein methyltransferase CheR